MYSDGCMIYDSFFPCENYNTLSVSWRHLTHGSLTSFFILFIMGASEAYYLEERSNMMFIPYLLYTQYAIDAIDHSSTLISGCTIQV